MNTLENKKSNNSTFVILIFEISEFRNIGRFTFGRYKYWSPSKNSFLYPLNRNFFQIIN